jgi:hypothetical protein
VTLSAPSKLPASDQQVTYKWHKWHSWQWLKSDTLVVFLFLSLSVCFWVAGCCSCQATAKGKSEEMNGFKPRSSAVT